MPLFSDQTGRTISLPHTPNRIISLVPSQTELLSDLGLDEEVVGITKFCVHPENWFKTKTRIGGTKQLKTDIIHGLQPDLIIANKEENVKEQIEELQNHHPIWVSDVNDLDSAYEMIRQIGLLTNREQKGNELISHIRDEFSRVPDYTPIATCYLVWKDPYMTIGGDTFIHSMLNIAGFKNIFAEKIRYPEITVEELRTTNCKLLLLPSEPFPFKEKHVEKLRQQLPDAQIWLVDGEMFSWYGSRLKYAASYFIGLRNQLQL